MSLIIGYEATNHEKKHMPKALVAYSSRPLIRQGAAITVRKSYDKARLSVFPVRSNAPRMICSNRDDSLQRGWLDSVVRYASAPRRTTADTPVIPAAAIEPSGRPP